MYVLMEKHEMDLVASTCIIMSYNVLLHEYTRHTRTLPLLKDLEVSHEADLRGIGSFSEAAIRTHGLVSVHEVDVRLSFVKLVPLRRLQEIL
jgi:hypothetical protein